MLINVVNIKQITSCIETYNCLKTKYGRKGTVLCITLYRIYHWQSNFMKGRGEVLKFYIKIYFIYLFMIWLFMSWDRADGIATGYGMDDRGVGVRVPVGSRIFSSPRRPDLLLGPPNLVSNGYRNSFPGGKAADA
jgi:hypothetical protein